MGAIWCAFRDYTASVGEFVVGLVGAVKYKKVGLTCTLGVWFSVIISEIVYMPPRNTP